MYYKLTMRDNRVVFVPQSDLKSANMSPNFQKRLLQIKKKYPDTMDWELVENEEVPGQVVEPFHSDPYEDTRE